MADSAAQGARGARQLWPSGEVTGPGVCRLIKMKEAHSRVSLNSYNNMVKGHQGEKKGLIILNLLTLEVHNLFWFSFPLGLRDKGLGLLLLLRSGHITVCFIFLNVQDLN